MAEDRDSVPLQRLSQSNDHLEDDGIPEYYGRNLHISRSNATPTHDEELPSYSQVRSTGEIIGKGHSTLLHRSAWVTIVTIIYITMAIYAWVMTVILSFHPINGKSWGYEIKNTIYNNGESKINFAWSTKIYRSVCIVQSIVDVATLPLITAVCASAAVIFTQNQNDTGFRLRQLITLADRRWDDPSLYLSLARGRWKQHGSALLFVAIIVYILGAITYPIQSLFLTTRFVKIPTGPSNRGAISDFNTTDSEYSNLDTLAGLDVLQARNALSQADGHTYHPNIWNNGSGVQLLTLNGLSSDNFYSQLPSGFNTGLLRQFAPRVNSTASYETIVAAEFPANCSTESGALYLDYQSEYEFDDAGDFSYYGLIACMPASSTKSAWQMTRNRQDFTEVLYLNLTGSNIAASSYPDNTYATQYLYKITVNTTSGYFELPNYMNDNIAGPLLEVDPENLCDEKCMSQSSEDSWQTWKYARRATTSNTTTLEAGSLSPIYTKYKGPLLMTALATFGPNSFIDTFPAAYAAMEAESKATSAITTGSSGVCTANPPLSNLVLDTSEGQFYDECIFFDILSDGEWYPAGSLISTWLQWFTNNADRFPSAFTAAAYLCNAQLLNALPGSWDVYQDLGKDMKIPSISMVGIVLVSILMGIYLIPLLLLSLYAGNSVRWTGRLDSFVMLRFGAAAGDKVFPMLVGRKTEDVAQLDEVSGAVRDVSVAGAADEVVPMGKLGFGEGKRLMKGRRYECFKGDDEALNPQEFQRVQWRVHYR